MTTLEPAQLESWAAQVETAATWVSGSPARKLTALAEEIRAAAGGSGEAKPTRTRLSDREPTDSNALEPPTPTDLTF